MLYVTQAKHKYWNLGEDDIVRFEDNYGRAGTNK